MDAGSARAQRDSAWAPWREEELPPLPRWCAGGASSSALQPRGVADEQAGIVFGVGVDGPRAESTTSVGDGRSTIMIQRLAPEKRGEDVRRTLVDLGLGGSFDTVYVPLNRRQQANLGYAFVHFRSSAGARACLALLAGTSLQSLTSGRVCRATYSRMQGDEFLRHVADAHEWANSVGIRLGDEAPGGQRPPDVAAGAARGDPPSEAPPEAAALPAMLLEVLELGMLISL